jgi:hypothetical protein
VSERDKERDAEDSRKWYHLQYYHANAELINAKKRGRYASEKTRQEKRRSA